MFKKGFKFYTGMTAAAIAIVGGILIMLKYWRGAKEKFLDICNWVANIFIHQEDGDED